MPPLIQFEGTPLKVMRMRVRKACELASALQRNLIPFASLVECQTVGDTEAVIFEVEVELGQIKANDIKETERIATVFHAADDKAPETFSLRADFPLVPHVNLTDNEFPRSLCLYDQPYVELKRQWTPTRYIEQVRTWLALTAKGKLHRTDQPLEPLLINALGYIALPSSFSKLSDIPNIQIYLAARIWKHNQFFIVASDKKIESTLKYFPIVMATKPSLHGVIRHTPQTLNVLHELLMPLDFNLAEQLRNQLHVHQASEKKAGTTDKFYGSNLLLLIILPKLRTADGRVEANELLVFITAATIREIGIAIDAWEDTRGVLGRPMITNPAKRGQDIEIARLNPVFNLNRESAWTMSGYPTACSEMKITCIGAGALGSQIIMNFARVGFGTWTIIDDDVLLPHNLVRHALPAYSVGLAKAEGVAQTAADLTESPLSFKPIVANVLSPGSYSTEITQALTASDIILDMSASVAVARHLADLKDIVARRISVFLNPTGTDLVILAEDQDRTITLDALEMQYYRALIKEDNLKNHFTPVDNRQRYGQTCRDVTSRIPQESMSLHGAIASRAIRSIVSEKKPRISVWHSNPDFSVSHITVEPATIETLFLCEWRVICDDWLFCELHRLRESKLPTETGGVLIGSFDLDRRIAYIVDTIPSPPDSEEWPTLYIRGCRGLSTKVKDISKKTDGALQYVGEWHSHPKGSATRPSGDDKTVFKWLTAEMDRDGLPALMMIVGDDARLSLFIGTME